MSTVSNEITATIVDANHPRLQGLQSLFQQLHQAWERLELDGREEAEEANTLHTDLGAEIEGPNLRLTQEAIDNLERRCHLFASHLHETALRLVIPGIASGFRNDLDAAVAEFRANAVAHEGQLDRNHDWVELHRERITELTTRLGNLTHSPTGTIPRMKDRIRALEDDNHHLREAIDELRSDVETLRTALEAAGNRTPARQEPLEEAPARRESPQIPVPPARRGSSQIPPASSSASEPRNGTRFSDEPYSRRPKTLELNKPTIFTGTDKTVVFSNWWRGVTQYLNATPDEEKGGELRQIVWLGGYLAGEAQEWYWDWDHRREEGLVIGTWKQFSLDINGRFRDDRENVRAYQKLLALKYRNGDSMHTFLTRWDALCLKANIKDLIYRQMLLSAVGEEVRKRMHMVVPAEEDNAFRGQILQAGRTVEHWAAEEPVRTNNASAQRSIPRPEPPTTHPTTTVTTTTPAAAAAAAAAAPRPRPWPRPTGTNGNAAPRFEQRFPTIADAVRGIPQEVVEARRTRGDCLRCGQRRGSPGEHRALFCYRSANMQPPLARPLEGNQVAAIELGKRPIEAEWELDESWKRSRIEDGGKDVSLYADDAGYDSEDRFED
jgi:hypothetical protein